MSSYQPRRKRSCPNCKQLITADHMARHKRSLKCLNYTTESETDSSFDPPKNIVIIEKAANAPGNYNVPLVYKKLSPNAYDPVRASEFAAGIDLTAAEDRVILPHNRAAIPTDLAFEFPDNCYGRIAPRSGLALHHCIDVGAGIIDRDYTGNVTVLLVNHSKVPYHVKKGTRIAQLICEVCFYPCLLQVDTEYTFMETKRGYRGFGSTGSEALQTNF